MSVLIRCDHCGTENSEESAVFWLRLLYTSRHLVEAEDDDDKDFCSWRCTAQYAAAQYAAEMAERLGR